MESRAGEFMGRSERLYRMKATYSPGSLGSGPWWLSSGGVGAGEGARPQAGPGAQIEP
ncbi:protein of unknown function [Methanoculleus bourgensis]|uniref:Uncharacterized protein n=1 Tax=Methanoculleus bourgensis TaxID=83986 RepID=A0A0X3BQB8_9EURY|nr:protein of unknown function [Methanoculleus bourgensis]